MKILFQGDSITDAFRRPDETNPAYQLGNGYVFLVASRLGLDHPNRHFQFVNRGVSGEGSVDLLRRWEEDAIKVRPDVLSLLVGINDVVHHFSGRSPTSAEQYEINFRHLLGRIRTSNPVVHFILLEPFLLPSEDKRQSWMEMVIALQQVVKALAAEYGATYIALQKPFEEACAVRPAEYWSYDGIHPTHAGFQLIADAWLREAKEVLFG